jgi:diguanylate cyclase (GGDEF)-like protein
MSNSSSSMIVRSIADLTTHVDREDVLHAVARLFREFLDARTVALYRVVKEDAAPRLKRLLMLDRGGLATELAAALESVHPEFLTIEGDWHRCVNDLQTVSRAGIDGHIVTGFPSANERGEVQGVFVTETSLPLDRRDAQMVSGILGILRNYVALLDYGQRDTLTGLLNRKTFESQFDRIRQQLTATTTGAEDEPQGWLGLIDIDRFKNINDTYGHLFGDEVLLLVSQLIRRSFRSSDLQYRFGGEEFVVLLPSLPEHHAGLAFERLRASVEAYTFPQVGRVTVSLGWTRISALDGPTTCLERADAALYKAKGEGRNRCIRYESFASASPAPDGDIELF